MFSRQILCFCSSWKTLFNYSIVCSLEGLGIRNSFIAELCKSGLFKNFFQLEDNGLTILCWFLLYNNMN